MRGVSRIMAMVVALAMCSCLAPQNSQMVGVDARAWSKADSLIYENNDTVTRRNINIAVRYNSDLKQSSLPIKIAITTPDERTFVDTVALHLQHPTTAHTVSTTESVPYRTDVILRQEGGYTFSFEPLSEVRGVEAIGVEIK